MRRRTGLRDDEGIVELLGAERPVVLARELTKMQEEFIRGSAAEVLAAVQEHEIKGEITLLIGKGAGADLGKGYCAKAGGDHARAEIGCEGWLKVVAKEHGISKSEVYRELQRMKRKK